MAGYQISRASAERIVNAGTRRVYTNYQFIPELPRTLRMQEERYCLFQNEGRWPIEPGEFVGITGMIDSIEDSEVAIDNWRRDGIRVRVKRIGLIDDANAAWLANGVALDAIPAGGTGRGTVYDTFMALIWRDPDVISEARRFLERADWKTAEWTDPNGTVREMRRLSFVKYPGDFTCIDAARPDADDNVFSLLKIAPPGPSLDRIESVDISSNTAVMACGVTASSPVATLTANDEGTRGLLMRDSVTRRWHVLPQARTNS